MSEINCTCTDEYICNTCYEEYCKQEAEYYANLYYRESIADVNEEELPF